MFNCSCHKESGTFATPESDTSIRTVDSSNFFSETCPSRCSPRRFSSPGDSQQALMQAYQRNSSAGAAPWLSSPSFSPQMHAFSLGSPPLMPDVGTVTPPKSPYRCLLNLAHALRVAGRGKSPPPAERCSHVPVSLTSISFPFTTHHQRDHESSESTPGRAGRTIRREASATFAPRFVFMHSMRHCLQVHSLPACSSDQQALGCVLRSLLVKTRQDTKRLLRTRTFSQ
jgi:hypothetical protein